MNAKEFMKALDHIISEKHISKDTVLTAMENALASAYKKNNAKTNVKVSIDPDTGDIKVYAYYVVVDDFDDGHEEVLEDGSVVKVMPTVNPDAQILLDEAREMKSDAKVGDTITLEVTPADFGRLAASAAKQVLTQKIREAEKTAIMEEFHDKKGEMMVGLLAMEDVKNYYVDLGKTRAILPKSEMIPGEVLKMGTSIKVYITKVSETTKGPLILCSRKHYGFVKRLFEDYIPELADGTVMLYSVIRDPGVRSKVAVYSNDSHVDAIGSCIGPSGSRIGSILKELNGEKVDLVLYSEDPCEFISNALSPAKNVTVNIIDPVKKQALAIVSDDNLSLAIGKKHSNIKLASKLTKYHIEVKSLSQINAEGNRDD